MADDRQPTQGMPRPGGSAKPGKGDGTSDGVMPRDQRGAGGGGPVGPKDTGDGFHGGQSGAAYHGHGRLGEQEVEGQDNPNAPSGAS
jgi:hypothetical protein